MTTFKFDQLYSRLMYAFHNDEYYFSKFFLYNGHWLANDVSQGIYYKHFPFIDKLIGWIQVNRYFKIFQKKIDKIKWMNHHIFIYEIWTNKLY